MGLLKQIAEKFIPTESLSYFTKFTELYDKVSKSKLIPESIKKRLAQIRGNLDKKVSSIDKGVTSRIEGKKKLLEAKFLKEIKGYFGKKWEQIKPFLETIGVMKLWNKTQYYYGRVKEFITGKKTKDTSSPGIPLDIKPAKTPEKKTTPVAKKTTPKPKKKKTK